MSRDWSPDDREPEASGPSRVGGSGEAPPREEDWRTLVARAFHGGSDRFVVVRWHDRLVTVSPAQQATLRAIGTFRTVHARDLAQHRYGANQARADRDVQRLMRHGWVVQETAPGRHGGREQVVLTLTQDGYAFTRAHVVTDDQDLHFGLVKPKEQAHDAALYRMAMAETERLAQRGAVVHRVVLDADLKGQLASARNRPGTDAPEARTETAARALHLRVVDGTVQIPDVRLEYETREGTMARVDLELATDHYKPSQVAAKAQAGFTIYAPPSQTGRLTAALQDRGLVAEIVSL